ncbi:ABC transporter permease [Crossiella cryophila]|uniref:Putative ABC transport system permease protein n=1 Tax=Crossiella cryophila TaxID=43355 RepID=A0A7W7CBF3_9PSEU|nr:FtsX-like permease family protein [Crossiella cryophila]MBB4677970.1 putative ABC transport system permease protein [Crossiella cryophila]
MFSFAWKTIRARKAGFAAAFLALFGGAILLTACGVLLESGLFGGVAAQRYSAAPAVLGADRSITVELEKKSDKSEDLAEKVPLPAALVGEVARIPGVTRAVGEISFPATVVGRDNQVLSGADGGRSLGHGWASAELTPFTLSGGTAPGPNEVVLDAELAQRSRFSVGDQVRIMVDSAPRAYRVSGIAAPSGRDRLIRQSAVFFHDSTAKTLSGSPDQVAAIGVFGKVDNLDGKLPPGVLVHTGLDRGEAENLDGAQSRFVLTMVSGSFSGFVLMIVIFVTASTLALVLNQRRRELALLRAIAATPRQVRRLIGAETLLVSGVAALLGVAPGLYVAHWLRDFFVTIGVISPDFTLSLSPVPALATVLLCVGAAQLAAWSSAGRMLRLKPTEALGEAAVEPARLGRGRKITGAALLAVAGAGVVSTLFLPGELAMVPAGSSVLVAIIGIGLLGPVITGLATRVAAGVFLRSRRAERFLAAHNSTANSRRLAAAVTPLVLTIGFAVTQFYSGTTLSEATQHQARAATVADYVLTAPQGVPAEVAAAARRIPGVTASTPLIGTEIIAEDKNAAEEPLSKSKAYGVEGNQLTGTLKLTGVTGNLSDLRGDTVALSSTEASWLGKKIGDRVELYLGDRTKVTPKLIATFDRNLGYGDALFPQDVLLPHTTDRLADSILVAGNPSVHKALSELAGHYPGLQVRDKAELTVATDAQQEANLWLNRILLGVILLYVALSVVNSLVTSTLDRLGEVRLLRLLGGTRRQVLRMFRAESVLVVSIAVLIGSAVPVLPLAFLSLNLTGTPIPAGPLWVYLGIVGVSVLIGLCSIRLPARRLSRVARRQP